MRNKKIIIVYISVIIAVLISAGFVLTQGNRYTLRTGIMQAQEPEDTKIIFGQEGVVETEAVRVDNGELVVDLKAVEQGETAVAVSYTYNEEDVTVERPISHLRVIFCDIILEHSPGRFNFNGYMVVVYAFVCVLILTTAVMLWSFIDFRRQGNFSYKMIICGGVGIYLGVLWLFLVYKMLNHWVLHFGHFMQEVAETGGIVLLVLTPAMFILSILLSLSNIQLIRKEGKRPVNALGIVFGVLWFAATAFIIDFNSDAFSWMWNFPNSSIIRNILTYTIDYFECMFLSTVACAFLSTKYTPPYDRDYIIILGCGINRDGTLTPLLKGRVDSAVRFEQAQSEKCGKRAVFVPSGGQGADETISESEAMARYLLSLDIPSERILKEDKSINTFENMALSKKVIEENGGDIKEKKVAFATTNYHILRGYILSKKNGFDAKGISAKTKYYFYPNAFLREFIGLLVDQKWKHLIMVALICLLFLGYTFFVR